MIAAPAGTVLVPRVFGHIQPLHIRVAHNTRPVANHAGVNARVQQGGGTFWQVPREQRQTPRRMPIPRLRHFRIISICPFVIGSGHFCGVFGRVNVAKMVVMFGVCYELIPSISGADTVESRTA